MKRSVRAGWVQIGRVAMLEELLLSLPKRFQSANGCDVMQLLRELREREVEKCGVLYRERVDARTRVFFVEGRTQ